MQTTLDPRQRAGRLLAALAVLSTPPAAATVLTAGPAERTEIMPWPHRR
jgi:hypothetical protein